MDPIWTNGAWASNRVVFQMRTMLDQKIEGCFSRRIRKQIRQCLDGSNQPVISYFEFQILNRDFILKQIQHDL